MSEELALWHDFNVALVTAAAGLLGLLFVALSIHIRALNDQRNAELRSVARTVFLGYVVALAFGFLALLPQSLTAFGLELIALNVAALVPFAGAARSGLRATGVGYDRRGTMGQFAAGLRHSLDGISRHGAGAAGQSRSDRHARRRRRVAAQRVGPGVACAEFRREVGDRRGAARRARLARLHGDDHGRANLIREKVVGTLGPEQRAQPAGAGDHGRDRHRLAVTLDR